MQKKKRNFGILFFFKKAFLLMLSHCFISNMSHHFVIIIVSILGILFHFICVLFLIVWFYLPHCSLEMFESCFNHVHFVTLLYK